MTTHLDAAREQLAQAIEDNIGAQPGICGPCGGRWPNPECGHRGRPDACLPALPDYVACADAVLSSPAIAALILAAERRGMERSVGLVKRASLASRGPLSTAWNDAIDQIVFKIRAANEGLK